jgi:pimeloyl-ACP methyl ester carboxylesterase
MTARVSGEQLAELGEVTLAYETFGDPADPAMLLIMGLGAQMIYWPTELCETLRDRGFYVIRFDNRDAGRSTVLGIEPPTISQLASGQAEAPYRLEDMAGDAARLLDYLSVERAHIVGASMGGMIAQVFALEYPQRTQSLASIMSTTGDRAVGKPTEAAMAVLTTPAPTDRDGYIAVTVRGRGVIGTQPPNEARARDLAERAFDRGYHPDGTARQVAAIAVADDRTPRLGDVAAPTVVIHGSDDPLITRSGGEATAAAIPGAELVIIDGMGHDMPPEYLGVIADALVANASRADAS